MSDEPVFDPAAMEMDAYQGLGGDQLDLSDLAHPETVTLLLLNLRLAVARQQKAERQCAALRNSESALLRDREGLRVALAGARQKIQTTLLEVPLGIIGGFAVTFLTRDKPDPVAGWALLALSVAMLVAIRWSETRDLMHRDREEA